MLLLCYFNINPFFSGQEIHITPHIKVNNKDKYYQTSHYIKFVKNFFVTFMVQQIIVRC